MLYEVITRKSRHVTVRGIKLCGSRVQNDEVLGYGDKFSLIITYDDVDSVGPPATLVKMIIFGGGRNNFV